LGAIRLHRVICRALNGDWRATITRRALAGNRSPTAHHCRREGQVHARQLVLSTSNSTGLMTRKEVLAMRDTWSWASPPPLRRSAQRRRTPHGRRAGTHRKRRPREDHQRNGKTRAEGRQDQRHAGQHGQQPRPRVHLPNSRAGPDTAWRSRGDHRRRCHQAGATGPPPSLVGYERRFS